MSDGRDDRDKLTDGVRSKLRRRYNDPPPTPREEMWAVIEAGLMPRGAGEGTEGQDPDVVSLDEARTRRARWHKPAGWAVAAAALLVLGIGIGRVTVSPTDTTSTPTEAAATGTSDDAVLRAAALDHLGQTEALLTVVRADARQGRLEPGTGTWARGLLTQTRLLLDSKENDDPAMRDLLEDLELVLAQIVGVSEARDAGGARVQSELNLALQGLRERDVLPRIQAVVPPGAGVSGT